MGPGVDNSPGRRRVARREQRPSNKISPTSPLISWNRYSQLPQPKSQVKTRNRRSPGANALSSDDNSTNQGKQNQKKKRAGQEMGARKGGKEGG